MMEYIFAAGLLGFVLGYMGGKRQATPERPMRLVPTRFEMTPPGLVARAWADEENWRMHAVSFAWHGSLVGFSYGALGPNGAQVVRRAAWSTYTSVLVEMGVLARPHERATTGFTSGWSAVKLNVALRNRTIPLPNWPPGQPPELNSGFLAKQMTKGNIRRHAGTGKLGVAL